MALIGEYLKNLIQLIFAPAKGWEDMEYGSASTHGADSLHIANPSKRDCTDTEERLAEKNYYHCFLPIAAACGCSAFVRLFYSGGPDFLEAFQRALITFVSLFLSSQIARYGFMLYLPKLITRQRKVNRGRALNMIMYCLTFLGLIFMVTNIIKVRIALIEFLPFYAIFIIWKGWKYIGIDERHEGVFMILATALILGSTYLIAFILNSLL